MTKQIEASNKGIARAMDLLTIDVEAKLYVILAYIKKLKGSGSSQKEAVRLF